MKLDLVWFINVFSIFLNNKLEAIPSNSISVLPLEIKTLTPLTCSQFVMFSTLEKISFSNSQFNISLDDFFIQLNLLDQNSCIVFGKFITKHSNCLHIPWDFTTNKFENPLEISTSDLSLVDNNWEICIGQMEFESNFQNPTNLYFHFKLNQLSSMLSQNQMIEKNSIQSFEDISLNLDDAETLSLYVADVEDTFSEHCNFTVHSNLRCAIKLCNQLNRTQCLIYLPEYSHLSYGEIVLDSNQHISLIGIESGSYIESIGNNLGQRFMNVSNTNQHDFNLHLSNINFINFNSSGQGGVFYLSYVSSLSISNVIFENNSATNGGAIYFEFNNDNITIVSSKFINNKASNNGGSLYFEDFNSNINITDCLIIENSAIKGGFSYFHNSNRDITFQNTLFQDNIATYGGICYFYVFNYNVTWQSITGLRMSADYGGLLYAEYGNTEFIVIDSNFTQNTGNYAGFYFNVFNSNIFLLGIHFSDIAGGESAVLFLNTINSQIAFKDCIFLRNFGAVLYSYWSNQDILISNSEFRDSSSYSSLIFTQSSSISMIGCVATNNFDGILFSQFDTILILDSLFEYNTADFSMGAVATLYSTQQLQIIRSTFVSNFAERYAGVIYSELSDYDSIYLFDSLFINNEGSFYSAIVQSSGKVQVFRCYFAGNQGNLAGLFSTSKIDLIDNVFFHNFAYGLGGIIDSSSSAVAFLYNCIFASGIGPVLTTFQSSSTIIVNCLFQSNSGFSIGGVGLILYSPITLFNSVFFNNKADLGGGLYISSSSFVNIASCHFYENLATSGSALYFDTVDSISILNSDFRGYKTDCIVLSSTTNAVIAEIKFSNPEYSYSGSAINLLQYNSHITFRGVVFQSQSAENGGAVRAFWYNYNISFLDSLFVNNTGINGGAINLNTFNYNFLFSNCIFQNNVAVSGGAIYLNIENSHFTITDSLFLDNAAFNSGGSIYCVDFIKQISISDSTFSRNLAVVDGGALYVGISIEIKILNCIFDHNIAHLNGGAIYILLDGSIGIHQSSFHLNQVKGTGGAINVQAYNTFQFIDNEFNLNSAFYGGGVNIGQFNHPSTLTDCNFINNSAISGGGIRIGILNSLVSIDECNIHSNIAENGGGVFVDEFSALSASGANFINNRATVEGGAIYYYSDLLSLTNSEFQFNNAVKSGGAIYFIDSTFNFISNSSFSLNFAESGGGIYGVMAKYLIITNSSFHQNFCSLNGAGVSLLSGLNINITASSFFNHLSHFGSAIYSVDSTNVILEHNTFQFNKAMSDGGCLYLQTSQGQIHSNNFEQNVAQTGSGSCIWFAASDIDIVSNYFFQNKALYGGGVVYWVYDEVSSIRSQLIPTNNFFGSNIASYGSKVATNGIKLGAFEALTRERKLQIAELVDFSNPYKVRVEFQDFYNQVVDIDSSNYVTVSVVSSESNCLQNNPTLGGGIVSRMLNGISILDSIVIKCIPGGNLTLKVSLNEETAESYLQVGIRRCGRGEYYADESCIVCPNNSYSLDSNSHNQVVSCNPCPHEAISCYGNTINAKSGYWRINADASSLIKCPIKLGCEGGVNTGNNMCAEGYEGPLCGVCSNGFYFESFTSTCKSCGKSNLSVFNIVLFGLIFVLCVVIFFQFFWQYLLEKISSLLGLDSLSFINNERFRALAFVRAELNRTRMQKLKQITTLYQILTALPQVLTFAFPNAYSKLIALFSLLNLNFTKDLGLACRFASFDYVDYLLLTTVLPIVVVLGLWLCYFTHKTLITCQFSSRFSIVASVTDRIQKLTYTYLYIFLILTYLALPGISIVIFNMLNICVDADPDDVSPGSDRYMYADLSVSCNSPKYYFGVKWAIAMIFVYPIGIPLMYLFMLYNIRNKIVKKENYEMSESNFQFHQLSQSVDDFVSSNYELLPLRFLYEDYKPQYWYWEIIETLRRLMLTGGLTLIYPGSSKQVIVGMFIALFMKEWYGYMEPFEDSTLGYSFAVCSMQIVIVLFITLILRENVAVSRLAIQISLVLSIIAILVYQLFQFLEELTKMWKIRQKIGRILKMDNDVDVAVADVNPKDTNNDGNGNSKPDDQTRSTEMIVMTSSLNI